mgnify:CR=1 FL=1
MTTLGQRIKQLRKENNLSQEALAYLLHVERTTITGYETKDRIPDITILIRMAEIFNVSLDELVGRYEK